MPSVNKTASSFVIKMLFCPACIIKKAVLAHGGVSLVKPFGKPRCFVNKVAAVFSPPAADASLN